MGKLFYKINILCTILCIIIGCRGNDFKSNCMNARKIIQEANNLLVISNVNVKDEMIDKTKSSIVIQHNNDKAISFLKSKESELKRYYYEIKDHLNNRNGDNDDSLFVIVFINEMNYFISGSSIEDQCYYLNKIKEKKNPKLSKWVVDDFFAPLRPNKNLLESWSKMRKEKKCEIIYNSLILSFEKQCR